MLHNFNDINVLTLHSLNRVQTNVYHTPLLQWESVKFYYIKVSLP